VPILVRPVREQLEHDRIIRLLEAQWRRKYKVDANPGDERNAAVKVGTSTLYPDLVLTEEGGRKPRAIVEVETGESVNHLEAMAQWANFARSKSSLYLFVPAGSVETARRLASDHQIELTELWTYLIIGDQVRFTAVFGDNGDNEMILAERPLVVPPPPPRAPAPIEMAVADERPSEAGSAAAPADNKPAAGKPGSAKGTKSAASAPAVSKPVEVKAPAVKAAAKPTAVPPSAAKPAPVKTAPPVKAAKASPAPPDRGPEKIAGKTAAKPALKAASKSPAAKAEKTTAGKRPVPARHAAPTRPAASRPASRTPARSGLRTAARPAAPARPPARPVSRAVAARPANGRSTTKRAPARPAATKRVASKPTRAQKRR
jgi:hypothetical protein